MGKHRCRCPVCGMLVYESSIDKFYEIETFENKSMGRARGVKLFSIVDLPFVERVKHKIKVLYEFFFPLELKPSLNFSFRPVSRQKIRPISRQKSRPVSRLKTSFGSLSQKIFPPVRYEEVKNT